jgi:inner membrane protein
MSAYFTADVVWFSLGIVLLIIEVTTGGFWIGFFGVGALVAAAAVWLGLADSLNVQIAIFLTASVASLLGLRRTLKKWLDGKSPPMSFGDAIGKTAVVVQAIPARGAGRVEFQGTTWDAESSSGDAVAAQTTVRIVRQDGTRLYVSATT